MRRFVWSDARRREVGCRNEIGPSNAKNKGEGGRGRRLRSQVLDVRCLSLKFQVAREEAPGRRHRLQLSDSAIADKSPLMLRQHSFVPRK
jgi:hypothetical protein